MSSKQYVVKFLNKYHGDVVTFSKMEAKLEAILEEYGTMRCKEGVKQGEEEVLSQISTNPPSISEKIVWAKCKGKALRIANAWNDPKYPEAAGSMAAQGIKKDLKVLL